MALARLTYVSHSNHFISWDMVKDILFVAQEHNKQHDITGLLVSHNMRFLQTLEGEESEIKDLYNKITSDKRHTECQILECSPISNRQFGQWNMKGFDFDALNEKQKAYILSHYCNGSEDFYIPEDADACLKLIHDLELVH